ncbi:MAG TPA: hypothetical protein VN375_16530 [Vicinamibacteria bacterium]|jgi:hypothetical protein|nr:hypothetical protein [Vicinamibacteria bacterium]
MRAARLYHILDLAPRAARRPSDGSRSALDHLRQPFEIDPPATMPSLQEEHTVGHAPAAIATCGETLESGPFPRWPGMGLRVASFAT